MMWAAPAVLRELIERYEGLRALAHGGDLEPQVSNQLRDTAYTLCVSTGTRDIEAALDAARARILPLAGPEGHTADPL